MGPHKLILGKSCHYLVKSPGLIELWQHCEARYFIWARNGLHIGAESKQAAKLNIEPLPGGSSASRVCPEMIHENFQLDVKARSEPERLDCLIQRPDGTQTVQSIFIYDDLELL